MELVLGVLAVLTILCFCLAAGYKTESFAASGVAVIVGAFFMWLISNGRTISLDTNTNYTVAEVFHSNAGSVILELKSSEWIDTYTYKVNCIDLKGGCPESWPKKFNAVQDGKQYVVVPIESESEK